VECPECREDMLKKIGAVESCNKIRPPRKEIYGTLITIALGFLVFLGYLWLAVGAKANDDEFRRYKDVMMENSKQTALSVQRTENTVNNAMRIILEERERSIKTDEKHDDCDKELDNRLDALE